MARSTHSAIWNYFDRDFDTKKASCLMCGRILSYKATINNLKRHVKNKHVEAYSELLTQKAAGNGKSKLGATLLLDKDEESVQSEVQGSDTWSFFEKETGGRVRCVICRETMSNHAATMRTHLKRDHPNLTLKTSDNDSDNEESHNDAHTEVVYLIDPNPEDTKVTKTPTKGTPKKVAFIHQKSKPTFVKVKKPRIRTRSSSSDPNEAEAEELEKFGKYVTCLMKTVPKNICRKLQMDIINLIMTIKIEKNEPPDLAPQSLDVAGNNSNNSSNILLERLPATSQITNSGSSPYIVAVANENGKVQRVITNNALLNTVTVVDTKGLKS